MIDHLEINQGNKLYSKFEKAQLDINSDEGKRRDWSDLQTASDIFNNKLQPISTNFKYVVSDLKQLSLD